MDSTRHRDRVVVVTGAASGIGRAVAVQMAAEGARLVLTDVNEEQLQQTAALVRDVGGVWSTVAADVADPSAAQRLLAAADALGPTHMLANIAGVMEEPRSEWAYERFQVQFAKGTRVVEPEEIAGVISWLGSDEAGNVNGATVHADGGMSAF